MKNKLQTWLLTGLLAVLAGLSRGYAAPEMGGQITYFCVAPGGYKVTYVLYNDCSGTPAPLTQTLTLKSAGCNAGRTVTMNKVGFYIGNPYCQAIPKLCSPTAAYFNYSGTTYEATVTFSAAEQTCPHWTFSVEAGNWSNVENLVNPGVHNLYTEAYLYLSPGVNNNSPEINPLNVPIPFVCVGQESRFSFGAGESDCDSISYDLVQPLSTGGAPIPYKQNPVALAGSFQNPKPQLPFCNTCTPPNPQTGTVATGSNTFSAAFPLPSYNANWAFGTQSVAAVPYFNLNPVTGEVWFKPQVYYANTAPALGRNRYAVAVRVNEWRKINGVVTKVGSIRRDMIFMVEDCGTKQNPTITNLTANGQPIQSGDIITVQPLSYLEIKFHATDPDGGTIRIMSFQNGINIGGTFQHNPANFPNTALVASGMGLAPSHFSCDVGYINFDVKDDNCPILGATTLVVGIRFSMTGPFTGVKEAEELGRQISVFPNPSSGPVNFKLAGPKSGESVIVIYNLLGREIDRIPVGNLPAGEQTIRWEKVAAFAAGTYVARLISEAKTVQTLKFSKLQ
jgi:hypothetical protein